MTDEDTTIPKRRINRTTLTILLLSIAVGTLIFIATCGGSL